jgi:hypothetical protein
MKVRYAEQVNLDSDKPVFAYIMKDLSKEVTTAFA